MLVSAIRSTIQWLEINPRFGFASPLKMQKQFEKASRKPFPLFSLTKFSPLYCLQTLLLLNLINQEKVPNRRQANGPWN
jgi:hypothetical protein